MRVKVRSKWERSLFTLLIRLGCPAPGDFLARAITPPGRPRRVEGAVHPEAELVELDWTPLDEALNLDLPDITRAALADLVQALDGGLDKRRRCPFYRQLRGKRLREQL